MMRGIINFVKMSIVKLFVKSPNSNSELRLDKQQTIEQLKVACHSDAIYFNYAKNVNENNSLEWDWQNYLIMTCKN